MLLWHGKREKEVSVRERDQERPPDDERDNCNLLKPNKRTERASGESRREPVSGGEGQTGRDAWGSLVRCWRMQERQNGCL